MMPSSQLQSQLMWAMPDEWSLYVLLEVTWVGSLLSAWLLLRVAPL